MSLNRLLQAAGKSIEIMRYKWDMKEDLLTN